MIVYKLIDRPDWIERLKETLQTCNDGDVIVTQDIRYLVAYQIKDEIAPNKKVTITDRADFYEKPMYTKQGWIIIVTGMILSFLVLWPIFAYLEV